MTQSILRGVGSYLPEKILTNKDLEETIDTTDEWIKERTGISQRHVAAQNEYTSDLAVIAAKSALSNAEMSTQDIDLIIVATTTPDYTFPSTATIVQKKLGIKHGAAFDIQAVCSGFIYGMSIADSMLKSGSAKNVLLIGAETFSRILDWNDRSTCVLFGDGAGAFILSSDNVTDFGILNTLIRSNGEHRELLYVDGGPSKSENVGKLRMIGNQVFKHAVKDIASIMNECADSYGVAISDIDWFVPHQANQRILNGVAKRLCLNDEQVISTVSIHANTSAASVPLAMDFAIKDGRIKRGDLIMLEAFGGGFTWGASLLRY
jgi:3-oxoacyl-[acyl-carrier-protein] synthase-3